MDNRVARIAAALAIVGAWALVTWRWMSRWVSRTGGGDSEE